MKKLIQEDRKLQLLLVIALIIQTLTCITAIGFYHPDQHFQVIEYSSMQLKNQSAATQVWELGAHIRPTLQVYLFSAWYIAVKFIGIADPYMQLMILRIILGLTMLGLYNAICIWYFRTFPKTVLYAVLLILNFSWFLPYSRTLYSSEMLSSLFFFGAIFLYDWRKTSMRMVPLALLTGFLFSLAFYFRFQMGFAIAGFLCWMLRFDREPIGPLAAGLPKPFIPLAVGFRKSIVPLAGGLRKSIGPLAAGFLIGVVLNTSLDYWFYHEWVITPLNYFRENITNGKAAEMGTASFLMYIGVLAALVVTPPLSLILLYTGVKGSLKMFRSPFVLPVLFFIVGHCLVGHKEERFLFPILNILPLLIGWGIPGLIEYYQRSKSWMKYLLNTCLVISLCLNTFLLVTLVFTPYSQAIYFTYLLQKQFNNHLVRIYSIKQSPFETENGLQLVFYSKSIKNIEIIKIPAIDSLLALKGRDMYIAATYNHTTDEEKKLLDQLGYKPVTYASELLWNINVFLHSRHINTINDIWLLYKKE